MKLSTYLFLAAASFSTFVHALPVERRSVEKLSTLDDDIFLVGGWGAAPANEEVADFFSTLKKGETYRCDVKTLRVRTGHTQKGSPLIMVYEVKNCERK